jgi:hypothetical protein
VLHSQAVLLRHTMMIIVVGTVDMIIVIVTVGIIVMIVTAIVMIEIAMIVTGIGKRVNY